MRYAINMPEICLRYAWDLLEICEPGVPEIYVRFTRDFLICLIYVRDILMIFLIFLWDMSEIYLRLAFRMFYTILIHFETFWIRIQPDHTGPKVTIIIYDHTWPSRLYMTMAIGTKKDHKWGHTIPQQTIQYHTGPFKTIQEPFTRIYWFQTFCHLIY